MKEEEMSKRGSNMGSLTRERSVRISDEGLINPRDR